jgi:hypothetical protein
MAFGKNIAVAEPGRGGTDETEKGRRAGGGIDPVSPGGSGGDDEAAGGCDEIPRPMIVALRANGVAAEVGID